ncbi:hypothetical protein SHI21_16405 [Bacteriovorax sp. PP10]|uniref:Uncharacterized protein n=1 Tax=Bacteriovorax antarcticus TaxID=3088717 RepID=A0ABU5VXM5_9BACT|nr:hypothetical protein [Bacteriovorax sp. PP10]MEA9357814.1 hypothetical protein [Bacteriovorax sp. PP10]
MIKKLTLLSLCLPFSLHASIDTSVRGYLSAKGNYYTADAEENFGSRARAQLEQESKFTNDFVLVNQVRFTYSSLYTDVSKNQSTDDKNTREIYLGDNYLKYKSSSWVLQTGYQDVGWGEAFGFNYADIVNPKDLRETFYTDYADSRLPLFLVNFKYFFENGSLQLIYSPEPRFSRALPVDLFTRGVLPQTNIKTNTEDTPDFFKKHEYGGKFSTSFWGIDASIFYFSYLDRDASYVLKSASLTNVELDETHSRVKTAGISVASTLYDNFVFRTDIVHTQDKKINSVSGFSLLNTPVDMTNVVLSLDTPTYSSFSGVLVLATSRLSKDLPQAFREKNQTYSIAKVSYDLGSEKTIDLSYTHEFNENGHAVQSLFTWPVNSTLEVRVGAETYWGDQNSQLSKIKNISNVFFGIKNYFQL